MNRFANNGRLPAEMCLPEAITDYDEGCAAGLLLVVVLSLAPETELLPIPVKLPVPLLWPAVPPFDKS